MSSPRPTPPRQHPEPAIRHEVRPGDLGSIVRMHGTIYAREHGFDPTFEAYVAGPLSEFILRRSERDRLWIAERDAHIVGSIAIVAAEQHTAQLRWYLVDPSARGTGLGSRLLEQAVTFARECKFESIFLWTVGDLAAAAKRYRSVGFERTQAHPRRLWGVDTVEERYDLDLT